MDQLKEKVTGEARVTNRSKILHKIKVFVETKSVSQDTVFS